MKIAITCDTHFGITTLDNIQQLSCRIQNDKPDIIVHAGDIGESLQTVFHVDSCLKTLKQENQILYAGIVGNHDLWSSKSLSKSFWETILPKTFQDSDWNYLEHENLVKNGVAIVGSYLHYDYSAAEIGGLADARIKAVFPDWTRDEYYERKKKEVVNDARFLIGLPKDKDFAKEIGTGFQNRLLQAENDPNVHSIVIVTHVSCMPTQITRKSDDLHWSLATAYFGNLSHVQTIINCSKVKFVVSGHSHQANSSVVEANDGHEIQVINIGSDYGKPIHELIEISP